jgi:Ni/Fe-hydrogenase subunit HybB-like protein
VTFLRFLRDGLGAALRGGPPYLGWLILLLVLILQGVRSFGRQWSEGLIVTGMSDQVSWGFYVANFAFFVGIAAAAVLLVVPAYIFHRADVKEVVLIGEGMAVAAVLVAIAFLSADLGRLDRVWHVIPLVGWLNFPQSILAWDILVLTGYLLLNLAIPMYILFQHYQGKQPILRRYFFFVVLAMFWAISIHTVTAFLFSSNPARHFWHTSLLAPRFIASAFTAGPALMIIALQVIRKLTVYPINQSVISMLALIMTVAMQINLYFVGSELFTDFYNEGEHAASIHYLFLGLEGFDALRLWIWVALALNVAAVVILMIHRTRNNMVALSIACVMAFVGIWIEKGLGLVVTGFIPTPLGEIFEYSPTPPELSISLGIWAMGLLVFTLLVKAGIAVELGYVGSARASSRMEAEQRLP